jgi:predicted TIM-barrel fold metal-dependent hydrolase
MLDDIFVINPVAHAYNLRPDNLVASKYAKPLYDQLQWLHLGWNPPGVGLSPEEQATDWTVETLAKTLFLESDVDLAAHHTLRLDSYFKDGLCRHEKTLEAVSRYPQRFLAYVGLDPTKGLEACLHELDEQLAEIPNPVGLKFYPAQVDPLRSWRMDDPALAFPLFERAREVGIKTIAIHKAAPLGPVPVDPFRIDDIEGAADAFPDLSFEIVHAGIAFATETAMAIGRYANVYANLEVTSSLLIKAPKHFERVLGEFLTWASPEKVIFSDGCMVFHSQPLLEAFRDLHHLDEFGIELTHADKALILGGNYARIIGLDVEQAKAQIADDEFARQRAESGRQEPYSNWRAELAAAPVAVA